MTTYYVDNTLPGSDSNAGTSVGAPFLTWGKAASVVAAGDTVRIRAGSYYEMLTIATSGTAGNPVTWVGDYAGTWFPTGGVVRLTGAASNNQSASRAQCITATTKAYQTFKGIAFDCGTSYCALLNTSCTDFTFQDCSFGLLPLSFSYAIYTDGASQARLTVERCIFHGGMQHAIGMAHSATVSNAGHTITSCIFDGGITIGVRSDRVGGIAVNGCISIAGVTPFRSVVALAAGQTMTVNNTVILGASSNGIQSAVLGDVLEDFNTFFGCTSNRSNVSTGAGSKTWPALPDMRWFFETVLGAKTLTTPYDNASYSALINAIASGAPSTDMRGASVAGGTREIGPLEYNSALSYAAGGGVTMWPLSNGFIQSLIGGGV